MVNLFSIISVAIIFVIILVVFSSEKLDYLTIAILGALVACLILLFTAEPDQNIETSTFVNMVEFQPLMLKSKSRSSLNVCEMSSCYQKKRKINGTRIRRWNEDERHGWTGRSCGTRNSIVPTRVVSLRS